MGARISGGWLSGSLQDDKGREWPIRRFPEPADRGRLLVARPNLVLHTTETFRRELADDGYVEDLRFPSQWQCGGAIIGQHIELGFAGDALNTWDRVAQQIEMVADSQLGLWLPVEDTLGPTVALTAWLHRTGRIKTGLKRPDGQNWPTVLDRGPQARLDYYRRHAGLWPDTPGVYGHVDIKDNHHWDPGSFNYPVFFRRVKAAIAVQEGDAVATADIRKGSQAFRRGDPLPTGANADFRFGYSLEKRIKRARALPEAPEAVAGHCADDCSCRVPVLVQHRHDEGTSGLAVGEA